jgi:hypothetical protein
MKQWTFKVFIKSNGQDAFEEWISAQDVDMEERIRARLDMMSITKIWSRPYFDILHGYKHIHEIIIKGRDKQYRPLGCFGPGPQVFTLLVGASKKGAVWNPPNAKETAEKRHKLVFEDRNRRWIGEYQRRERDTKKTSEG